MFVLALLHAIVQTPRILIKRSTVTCKESYQPTVAITSSTATYPAHLMSNWNNVVIKSLNRAANLSESDEQLILEHLNRAGNWTKEPKVFHLMFSIYNHTTQKSTFRGYQLSNLKNPLKVDVYQLNSHSEYALDNFSFFGVASYFVTGGMVTSVMENISLNSVNLTEEVVDALAAPLYGIVYGFDFANKDPFTQAVATEILNGTESYLSKLPYITDTVQYVQGAVQTYKDNGKMTMKPVDDAIEKLCREKRGNRPL